MLRINIFISYRSLDEKARDQVITCLKPLEMSYEEKYKVHLKIWYDDFDMRTGDNIEFTISENLEKSHIVVCLLTPNYFSSDWCQLELRTSYDHTKPPSKKRLVPLIYDNVNWQTDWLRDIKVFPAADTPPLLLWENQNEAFERVSKEIDDNIKLFVNPSTLDFISKKLCIENALLQDVPDFKLSVNNLMSAVREHMPECMEEAIEVHVTNSIYESKEYEVKIAELLETKRTLIKMIFVILKKIEQKYAI